MLFSRALKSVDNIRARKDFIVVHEGMPRIASDASREHKIAVRFTANDGSTNTLGGVAFLALRSFTVSTVTNDVKCI